MVIPYMTLQIKGLTEEENWRCLVDNTQTTSDPNVYTYAHEDGGSRSQNESKGKSGGETVDTPPTDSSVHTGSEG